jgi:hypothetical protein
LFGKILSQNSVATHLSTQFELNFAALEKENIVQQSSDCGFLFSGIG